MQPEPVVALADELARLYTDVQDSLISQLEAIAQDPNQHRLRARLTEQSKAISDALDDVDRQARVFLSRRFASAYGVGMEEVARATGQTTVWTQIHLDAVGEIAQQTFEDLLSATAYVRRDTKRLIREAVRARTAEAVIGGQTSTQVGRALAKELEGRGVAAVVYSNGTRHTLGDYGDMAVRTAVARVNVAGSLNAGKEAGVRYWLCSDGASCGVSSHNDPELANGLVAPTETAEAYPIAHPRCARSWSPMPQVTTDEEARRLIPPEEERQALAAAERERAEVRTVSGRLTQRERVRRERHRARTARIPRTRR